ncbi:hypothetical protein Tco_0994291 [Tanacetum coccineum]
MITTLLWLHLRVIQSSNMSTLWDTPVRSGTYLLCLLMLFINHGELSFGVSFITSNIDYAERIWEEFVQSIQTFLTDRKNLTMTSCGKKKSSHLLIPSVRFTKLIIRHLKTKHNIHPRTGLPLHYSHKENVLNTLSTILQWIPGHVVEYQCYLDEDHDKAEEEEAVTESPNATKVTKPKAAKQTKPLAPKAPKVIKSADDKTPKPTSSQPPKPTPAPTEPSKKDQGKKHKLVKEASDTPSPAKSSKVGKVTKKRMTKSPLQLVDEFVDEGVPEKEPAYNEEEANLQWALRCSYVYMIKGTMKPRGGGDPSSSGGN